MARRSDVSPFLVMEVLEEAQRLDKQGADVVHMEVGEPDFDTPACIKEAAIKAMRDGATHYTSSLGILELREAICEDYFRRYGVQVEPDRVMVSSGTSPSIFMLYSVLLEKGDEVVLSNPYYACYPNFITFSEGVPVYFDVKESEGYQFDPAAVREKVGPRTRAIMICSPSNPTGVVLSPERLAEIANLGPTVVSDEIYHGLVYEGREHSALEFTDNCFVLNGFSKLYAMTGWRLGYVISPPEFVRPMQKIQQNLLICANSFVQWAGIAALTKAAPFVQEMVETYASRRKVLLARVRALGFGVAVEPTGAFYIFANARRFTDDVYSFCLEVLENAGVAIAPGIDFGSGGQGFVRFSYANSIQNIEEGARRLGEYLGRRAG